MLKYPALFTCLGLIVWLLVRDCRRRRGVSAAIWVPTLFLLVIGSRPLSIWVRGTSALSDRGAEGNPIDQIFFFSCLSLAFLVALSRRIRWSTLFARNVPLICLYAFFAISVLWSSDPVGSAKRLTKDFGIIFLVAVILTERNPLDAARAIYVRCAAVLFPLSLLFVKYFSELGRTFALDGSPMYIGVTTQKNGLGEIVLAFTLVILWDHLESTPPQLRWRRISLDRLLLLIMSILLLHISQSKTALLCLLFGSILIFATGSFASKSANRLVLLGTLCLPALMFFADGFTSMLAPALEAMGRNATFTGRANIWEHISFNTVNPLIGAGYWNFWGTKGGEQVSAEMHTPVPNAHCGYLDMYLDGGIIGLVMLFVVLGAYGRRLADLEPRPYQRTRFAILMVMMVYNLSESLYARLSPLWFTTILMLLDAPLIRKPHRKLVNATNDTVQDALSAF